MAEGWPVPSPPPSNFSPSRILVQEGTQSFHLAVGSTRVITEAERPLRPRPQGYLLLLLADSISHSKSGSSQVQESGNGLACGGMAGIVGSPLCR